jgi:hypothetical protein
MDHGENKWKTMTTEHTYKVPSDDSAKIIALEAQVQSLSNKYKTSAPAKSDAKKPHDNKAGPAKKKNDKRHEKSEWMVTHPGPWQPITKTINGKEGEFIWCAHHAAWGKHHEDTCKAKH